MKHLQPVFQNFHFVCTLEVRKHCHWKALGNAHRRWRLYEDIRNHWVILFLVAFQKLLEHMEPLYAGSEKMGYLIDLVLLSRNGTFHPHRVLQSSQSTAMRCSKGHWLCAGAAEEKAGPNSVPPIWKGSNLVKSPWHLGVWLDIILYGCRWNPFSEASERPESSTKDEERLNKLRLDLLSICGTQRCCRSACSVRRRVFKDSKLKPESWSGKNCCFKMVSRASSFRHQRQTCCRKSLYVDKAKTVWLLLKLLVELRIGPFCLCRLCLGACASCVSPFGFSPFPSVSKCSTIHGARGWQTKEQKAALTGERIPCHKKWCSHYDTMECLSLPAQSCFSEGMVLKQHCNLYQYECMSKCIRILWCKCTHIYIYIWQWVWYVRVSIYA